jgi:hypothetical protein
LEKRDVRMPMGELVRGHEGCGGDVHELLLRMNYALQDQIDRLNGRQEELGPTVDQLLKDQSHIKQLSAHYREIDD